MKIITVLMSCSIILSLFSCGNKSASSTESKVISTNAAVTSVVSNVDWQGWLKTYSSQLDWHEQELPEYKQKKQVPFRTSILESLLRNKEKEMILMLQSIDSNQIDVFKNEYATLEAHAKKVLDSYKKAEE